MFKNRRQLYAVNESAGHQHSVESWGIGRAVSRIPRVSGSGTSRAGQGVFGNMCCKGCMFAFTKVWRHWNRRINKNQRRYATALAFVASVFFVFVEACGHRVS
jgi:large subunit ribosomal protein L4e